VGLYAILGQALGTVFKFAAPIISALGVVPTVID